MISDFSLKYQKSPIALTGGIATNIPGGILPIVSITQAADYNSGLLQGTDTLNLEDYLFNFYPLPGATLIDNQVATYPFANQQVAANAVISEPLRISLLMEAPVSGDNGGYDNKLSVFQDLQQQLNQHTSLGGTYTVATPSYIYTNLLLLSLRDVSSADPKRPQSRWQWDFFQPLLTIQQAEAAQAIQMQKISSGAQVVATDGAVSWSGLAPALNNPTSSASPGVIPAAAPLASTSVGSGPPTGP
jgi:hypothetical protein